MTELTREERAVWEVVRHYDKAQPISRGEQAQSELFGKSEQLVAAYGEACKAFAWFKPYSLRALIDRAERAEAMIERLIEAGSEMYLETVPDFYTPEAYPNSGWTDWNAAVSDWLEQKGGVQGE